MSRNKEVRLGEEKMRLRQINKSNLRWVKQARYVLRALVSTKEFFVFFFYVLFVLE